MSQQTLLGGDGVTGESGATHNSKANSNFTELYAATAAAQADADAAESAISTHISANPAHSAANISSAAFGSIGATNVQAALEEIAAEAGAVTIPDASETVEGVAELATQAETNTGSDDLRIVTPLKLHTKIVGVYDEWIPSGAFIPKLTNGCSQLQQVEQSTSGFNIMTLDFDQTTQEFAQTQIVLPRRWNNGTVTFIPYWTASTGSGTVQWGVSLGAYSNDDALTVALGTAQTSDDTLIAVNDLHIGPESSAITIAGTPATSDMLAIQISRNVASDTLTGDAKLLGIILRFTVTAAKDA